MSLNHRPYCSLTRAASNTPIPSNPQVRILSSSHPSMQAAWRIGSLLEKNHLLRRITWWRIEGNWTPFHWVFRTCVLDVWLHPESQITHSTHSSHSSHWWLGVAYSGKRPVLNWAVFLLFCSLRLATVVSSTLRPSHWLVWLIDWSQRTDLPCLQSVKLGSGAFQNCQSIVFESDCVDGLMIQICQNSNRLSLANRLFGVMMTRIENDSR